MDFTARILYLDDYHLGDPLFLQSLARALAMAGPGQPPALLVHGSGEHAERLLEGRGLFVDRADGVLQVSSAEEAALVARAIRHANQKLVGLFTDAGVPVVGVTGADRGLLRVRADGTLVAGRLDWVERLMEQGGVPVVGAYVRAEEDEREGEVPAPAVAAALARALRTPRPAVVFFTATNLPGVMRGEDTVPELSLEAVSGDVVPDEAALRAVVAEGLPVLLTNTTRLASANGPHGTLIVE